jgi:hypothetical protein
MQASVCQTLADGNGHAEPLTLQLWSPPPTGIRAVAGPLTAARHATSVAAQITCSVCLRCHRDPDQWEQIGDEYICAACVALRDAANPPNVVVTDIDGRLRVVSKGDYELP